ncbi:MAG: tripartite tricarboxylate transporter substrate-binding protein [Dehalococcoidia bacterium]
MPFNPGGGFDAYSRAIARTMKNYLPDGINVIVKNMPGGGGATARTFLLRARPDGYSLSIIDSLGAAVEAVVFPDRVEYDFSKFTYFGQIVADPGVILVNPNGPYTTVDGLKGATKTVLGSITGVGSSSFSGQVILSEALGYETAFVSGYVGSVDAMTAVVRGDADLYINAVASARPFFESGDLLGMAVMEADGDPSAPNIPNAKEAGLPEELHGLKITSRMVHGPPNMPPDITAYYEDMFSKVLVDPDFVAWAKSAKRPLAVAGPDEANKTIDMLQKTFGKYKDPIAKAVAAIGG